MTLYRLALVLVLTSSLGSAADDCGTPAATASPSPEGKHYYLAQGGSDEGGCSKVAPCRQLARALIFLRAGDTLHLADAIYQGLEIAGVRGTAEKPIRIVGDGDHADFQPYDMYSTARELTIEVKRSQHVIFEKLNIQETLGYGFRVMDSSFITIRGGNYTNNLEAGIFAERSPDLIIEGNTVGGSKKKGGIIIGEKSPRAIVRNNRVFSNGNNGIYIKAESGVLQGARVEGNVIFDNMECGIRLDGVQGAVVANNMVYGNRNRGILLTWGIAGGGPKDLKVVNNTVLQPDGGRYPIEVVRSQGAVFLRNNLLLNATKRAAGVNFDKREDLIHADTDYNALESVAVNGGALKVAQLGTMGHPGETHSFAPPPLAKAFANLAKKDFSLPKQSPLRGKGAPVPDAVRDLAGKCRPNPPSIGAFE